jgi:hypothetical protein
MSTYWISCPDVITRETKHHEVDHSIYVYIKQLEHRLDKSITPIKEENVYFRNIYEGLEYTFNETSLRMLYQYAQTWISADPSFVRTRMWFSADPSPEEMVLFAKHLNHYSDLVRRVEERVEEPTNRILRDRLPEILKNRFTGKLGRVPAPIKHGVIRTFKIDYLFKSESDWFEFLNLGGLSE